MKIDTKFVPMKIIETRGRKPKIDVDWTVGVGWEFPEKYASTVRIMLFRFKRDVSPTWQFRTWIKDGKIYIARIK